ncbi:hypothetical protein YC2023_015191 [Brassica napus]
MRVKRHMNIVLPVFRDRQKDKGRPLPKFGEWDVNDPASAEGFTVIFNKARDEKKTGGKPGSPGKSTDGHAKSGGGGDPSKTQPNRVSFGCRKSGSAACNLQQWTLDGHKNWILLAAK